ncbi:hypothetical protein ABPG75_011116 [Micractinium tetrahymenae]
MHRTTTAQGGMEGGGYGGPGAAYGPGAYPQEGGGGYGYAERQAGPGPYEGGAMPPREASAYSQPYAAPPPGEGLYGGQEGYGQQGYGGRREGEGLVQRLEGEFVRRDL